METTEYFDLDLATDNSSSDSSDGAETVIFMPGEGCDHGNRGDDVTMETSNISNGGEVVMVVGDNNINGGNHDSDEIDNNEVIGSHDNNNDDDAVNNGVISSHDNDGDNNNEGDPNHGNNGNNNIDDDVNSNGVISNHDNDNGVVVDGEEQLEGDGGHGDGGDKNEDPPHDNDSDPDNKLPTLPTETTNLLDTFLDQLPGEEQRDTTELEDKVIDDPAAVEKDSDEYGVAMGGSSPPPFMKPPKRAIIRRAMQCAYCQQTKPPGGKIYKCGAGHTICGRDYERVVKREPTPPPLCPAPSKSGPCGSPLSLWGLKLYKIIYDNSVLNCPWHRAGCDEKMGAGELREHLRGGCYYSLATPCQNSYCTMTPLLFKYINHLTEEHSTPLFESPGQGGGVEVRIEQARLKYNQSLTMVGVGHYYYDWVAGVINKGDGVYLVRVREDQSCYSIWVQKGSFHGNAAGDDNNAEKSTAYYRLSLRSRSRSHSSTHPLQLWGEDDNKYLASGDVFRIEKYCLEGSYKIFREGGGYEWGVSVEVV